MNPDNVEIQKQRTDVLDRQLDQTPNDFTEQTQISIPSIPRISSFTHFMQTWQPMGIRVQVRLPYIGDDATPIFWIRNGPHIPDIVSLTNEDPWIYWLANQSPVIPGGEEETYSDDPAVVVSHFDSPPPLAYMCRMFRRWRGSMQYRVRTVGNFTQQAYIIAYMVRNYFRAPNIHNPWKLATPIVPKDSTHKDGMLNSYLMSDVSFQRHIELTTRFEYPNQFYDQYTWLSNRTLNDEGKPDSPTLVEPHGDNWIAIACRGSIAAETTGSISFELEYRAGEDFQFSDPFLAGAKFRYPIRNWRAIKDNPTKTYTVPDKTITSDGINTRTKS